MEYGYILLPDLGGDEATTKTTKLKCRCLYKLKKEKDHTKKTNMTTTPQKNTPAN